jgi:hypothetical protein
MSQLSKLKFIAVLGLLKGMGTGSTFKTIENPRSAVGLGVNGACRLSYKKQGQG